MQVASEREEVQQLGVFLDPLPAAISRALEAGSDFLLCHHPLTLKPQLPSRADDYFYALRLLMRANVALYAAHTSLDVNLSGPAGWLGRELELSDAGVLEPIGEGFGYGEIGNLPTPVPFGQIVNRLLKLTKMECANLAGSGAGGSCARLAYCGGSGGDFIALAQAKGADIYVTGDIRYHAALSAGIPVLDVGHHSLEEEMMRRFALLLGEMLPEIRVDFFPSLSPFRRACQ